MATSKPDLPRLRLNSSDDFEHQESWNAAFSDRKLSKGQQDVDNAINTIESTITSAQAQYDAVNGYFTANAGTITSAVNVITESVDLKVVENAISQFEEVAGVLVRGLDELAKLHPFVGVAVMAFKLVYTLDATRRENNKKVMVIKLQMKDMMIVLFELRHVKDASEVGPDGSSVTARMQTLMEEIAAEIKQCGSACDAYLKKGFFSKTFKSKIYADRLAHWGYVFEDRKEDISFALTMHTAVGVDRANVKLDGVGDGVGRVEKKMDAILNLFQKFETPRETELLRFIDENGGIQACLASDKLMSELQKREGGKRQDIDGYRKRIKKEAEEDVDEVLRKNFDLFSRKLDLQSQQLNDIDETIRAQGEKMMSVFLAGSHDDILHRNLKRIWQIGGWKGSVKARHFILTLYDYYEDHRDEICDSMTASPLSALPPRSALDPPPPLQPSSALPTVNMLATMAIKGRRLKHTRWALNFVNVFHLQPIIEAIDDDGTGFVTIKECNTFATDRPEGWSLLHWIAYWASGWHLSLTQYHAKIHSIISQMFTAVKHVLPENRPICDTYLISEPIHLIEKLLRSTRTRMTSDNKQAEEPLATIVAAYADGEEKRLEGKLKAIKYNLDLRSTVMLVTGPGRIERYLFPILYLVLKQHLSRFILASTRLLDTNEFECPIMSLNNVFGTVQERVNDLEAIFKQTAHAVEKRLKHFAYGMFYVGYDEKDNRFPKLHCLDPQKDLEDEDGKEVHAMDEEERLADTLVAHQDASRRLDASILIESQEFDADFRAFEVYDEIHAIYPRQSPIPSYDGDLETASTPSESSLLPFEEAPVPHEDVQGVWSTELVMWSQKFPMSWIGPLEIGFKFNEDPSSHNYALSGVAQSAAGRYTITGRYFPITHRLALKLTYTHGTEEIQSLVLRGAVDFDNQTVYGTWRSFPASEPSPQVPEALSNEDFRFNTEIRQPFTLGRTPVEYYRYRTVPYRGVTTVARCRWRFALGAVIHQVRKRAWSWHHIREHCVMRRRFGRIRLGGVVAGVGGVQFTESMKTPDPLWDFRRLRPDVAPADVQRWAGVGDSLSWDADKADAILDAPVETNPINPDGESATSVDSVVASVPTPDDISAAPTPGNTSPAAVCTPESLSLAHWGGVWNGHFFYYEVTGELCAFQGLAQLRISPPVSTPAKDLEEATENTEETTLDPHGAADDSKQVTTAECQNMNGLIKSSALTISQQSIVVTFTMPNGAIIDVTFTHEDTHDQIGGTWKLMSGVSPARPVIIGRKTFCVFTRTPSCLYKYRPMPDTAHVQQVPYLARNMARDRWVFLRRSVLHILRKRRWAWIYFQDRFSERRHFLDTQKRERIDQQSGFRAIDRAWHINTDFLMHIYPSDLGHCTYALLMKNFRKLLRHEDYSCDSCGNAIMTVRITCLECIKDDFTDNMDVCEACADKSCDRDGLDHKPSHAVLRCSTYLFANRYVRMVEKGKESWKQYKASFARVKAEVLSKPAKMASQDDALGHRAVAAMNLNASKAKSEAVLPQCTYCEKVIAPPFWGCIECPSEVHICNTCTKRHPDSMRPPASTHDWTHLLVRVWELDERDSSDDEDSASDSGFTLNGESKNKKNTNRLSTLEEKMVQAETATQALVSSVDPRLAALEVGLTGVRDDFEPRLSRLEDSMGRIEGLLNLIVQKMLVKSDTGSTSVNGS